MAAVLYDCQDASERMPAPQQKPKSHFLPVSPPILGKEMNATEMYKREKTPITDDLRGLE